LSDSHLRECAGVVQCVPQLFTHVGRGSFWYRSTARLVGDGFEERQALTASLPERWAVSVLSLSLAPALCCAHELSAGAQLRPEAAEGWCFRSHQRLVLQPVFWIIQCLAHI